MHGLPSYETVNDIEVADINGVYHCSLSSPCTWDHINSKARPFSPILQEIYILLASVIENDLLRPLTIE